MPNSHCADLEQHNSKKPSHLFLHLNIFICISEGLYVRCHKYLLN